MTNMNIVPMLTRRDFGKRALQAAVGAIALGGLATIHTSTTEAAGLATYPTLQQGSTGPYVTLLQQDLNAVGAINPPLKVDGQFGPLTAQAVINWEHLQHLPVDRGIAGPQVWASLNAALSVPTPRLTPPATGNLAAVIAHATTIFNTRPGIPYSWGGGHGPTPGPTIGTLGRDKNGKPTYTGKPKPGQFGYPTETIGVDCSGFTRWVYAQAFGRDVLGTGGTYKQIPLFRQVPESQAQPGDLVFFETAKLGLHHVGIYTAPNQMINALESGTRIQYNTLSASSGFKGYYRLKV